MAGCLALAAVGLILEPAPSSSETVAQRKTSTPPPLQEGKRKLHATAHVRIAQIGFTQDEDDAIEYGVILKNVSRTTDAQSVVVTVRAADQHGRSVAIQRTPISLIPAGGTFNLAGYVEPTVSSDVKKLRATIQVDRHSPKGEKLPQVTGVRLTTSLDQFIRVTGKLTNHSGKAISQNAPVYAIFVDAEGRVVGSTLDTTGAAVRPRASVTFRLDGFLNDASANPISARVWSIRAPTCDAYLEHGRLTPGASEG